MSTFKQSFSRSTSKVFTDTRDVIRAAEEFKMCKSLCYKDLSTAPVRQMFQFRLLFFLIVLFCPWSSYTHRNTHTPGHYLQTTLYPLSPVLVGASPARAEAGVIEKNTWWIKGPAQLCTSVFLVFVLCPHWASFNCAFPSYNSCVSSLCNHCSCLLWLCNSSHFTHTLCT